MDVSTTALSGLLAQTGRVAAVAGNVANQTSRGALNPSAGQPVAYQPVAATTVSAGAGAVRAVYQPLSQPVVPVADPSASYANAQGLVAAPNVDSGQQMLSMMSAHQAYKANLAVLKTADAMTREVLKITV